MYGRESDSESDNEVGHEHDEREEQFKNVLNFRKVRTIPPSSAKLQWQVQSPGASAVFPYKF